MCTAISICNKKHYFGRNLDYEHTFGEKVVITPKTYRFMFRNGGEVSQHSAIIGMALPYRNYPLYFDAMNEYGLAMAGLNFPLYAQYNKLKKDKENLASFELIPWILCNCKTVRDTEKQLKHINITNEAFDEMMQPTPLHWIVADQEKCITVEQTEKGLSIYQNPTGVLTNSPEFPIHLFQLNNYMSLSSEEPKNHFSKALDLTVYSRGMGALGLPGDVSSVSRFVRASFDAHNAVYGDDEQENLHQFFHLLSGVEQIKGCAKVGEGFEMTNYSSCMDTSAGIYYYKTYYDSRIYGVDMHKEDICGKKLVILDLLKDSAILFQN